MLFCIGVVVLFFVFFFFFGRLWCGVWLLGVGFFALFRFPTLFLFLFLGSSRISLQKTSTNKKYVRVFVVVYICIYIDVYVCTHVRMCVCMYVCMYVFIYVCAIAY